MHRVAVKKHNCICNVRNVPTTCFGPFWLGHHQVGYNCQRNHITIQYNHSVSVREGDEISFTKNMGVCGIDWWWYLDMCIG